MVELAAPPPRHHFRARFGCRSRTNPQHVRALLRRVQLRGYVPKTRAHRTWIPADATERPRRVASRTFPSNAPVSPRDGDTPTSGCVPSARSRPRRDPETRAIADPSHDARANSFLPLSIPVGARKGLATPRRVAARAAVAPSPFAKLQAGDKVKVTESVVVYHVPKSKGAATDLNGMEGEVASRADDLNGTYISANLEVRVAFAVPDDPKGKTFIAHMKEDEVEAL